MTDSDLALGYLNPDFFLGGTMRIDPGAANAALEGLSARLGLEASRAAPGIHDVVNENMAGAARVAIAERGRVPRDYALLATGGAAPVHAWNVAQKLGVTRVVCPPGAGAGSTIGMLMAPARIDRVASRNVPLAKADWTEIGATFTALEREALSIVTETGADLARRSVRRLADMRYVGQGSEITVVLPDVLDQASVLAVFEVAYRQLFGRTPPGAAVQFVALRLAVTAPMPGAGGQLRIGGTASGAPRKGSRMVTSPIPAWSRHRSMTAMRSPWAPSSMARRSSRKMKAPLSSAPMRASACCPTDRSWRSAWVMENRDPPPLRCGRDRAAVAATDFPGG